MCFRFTTRAMFLAVLLASIPLGLWIRRDFDRMAYDAVTQGDVRTVGRVAQIRPQAITNNRFADLLQLAAYRGDAATVKVIAPLFDPIDLKEIESLKCAYVASAVSGGSAEAVELLLEHGANLERTMNGATPLAIAVGRRRVDLINLLLEHGADPNRLSGNRSVLATAVRVLADAELIEVLLKNGANPNQGDALEVAVDSRESKVVELLLAYGAKADDSSLTTAVDDRRWDVVRMLVDSGADLSTANVPWTNGLCEIVADGDEDLAKWLIEQGADVDEAWTVIIGRYWSNHMTLQSADLLLRLGADVNAIDERGRNAIHHMARDFTMNEAQLEMLTRLLEAGADANRIDQSGKTPLRTRAAMRHPHDCVACRRFAEVLVRYGATPISASNDSIHQSPVAEK